MITVILVGYILDILVNTKIGKLENTPKYTIKYTIH